MYVTDCDLEKSFSFGMTVEIVAICAFRFVCKYFITSSTKMCDVELFEKPQVTEGCSRPLVLALFDKDM